MTANKNTLTHLRATPNITTRIHKDKHSRITAKNETHANTTATPSITRTTWYAILENPRTNTTAHQHNDTLTTPNPLSKHTPRAAIPWAATADPWAGEDSSKRFTDPINYPSLVF